MDWPGTMPEWKVQAVRETNVQLMFDDEEANCRAIQQQTECLTAHALPIPEMVQEYLSLLEDWDRRLARRRHETRGTEIGTRTETASGYPEPA